MKQANKSLQDITKVLADMIELRCMAGKDYGVILLPEGIIELIPEFVNLIREMNDKPADPEQKPTEESVLADSSLLSPAEAAVLQAGEAGALRAYLEERKRLYVEMQAPQDASLIAEPGGPSGPMRRPERW